MMTSQILKSVHFTKCKSPDILRMKLSRDTSNKKLTNCASSVLYGKKNCFVAEVTFKG